MAEVHNLAYGWINPILAFVLSFLGLLLGLVLVVRSRESSGAARVRWLTLAAVAMGGTGVWLMQFMAILGFDVPAAVLRYDVPMTIASLVIAVVVVALGLYIVALGPPVWWRVLAGGVFTGLGIAATHYTAMAALHLAGHVGYDPVRGGLSVVSAVMAGSALVWFAAVVRGAVATVTAAFVTAVFVCGTHYLGMSAVRVKLMIIDQPVSGVNLFSLLTPVSIAACVVVSALAYATVGFSIQQENATEDALARARLGARAAGRPRSGAAYPGGERQKPGSRHGVAAAFARADTAFARADAALAREAAPAARTPAARTGRISS